MNKKSSKNWMEAIVRGKEVAEKETYEAFYPNGILAKFSFSSEGDLLDSMIKKAKEQEKLAQNAISQNQILEKCIQIQNNVKLGKRNNIEICLDKGIQLFDKKVHSLGNTMIRTRIWSEKASPDFLFIKNGSSLAVRIFIGDANNSNEFDNNIDAFMAIKEEDGDYFIPLAEVYLLSIRETGYCQKETAMMTSYSWWNAQIYSSIILASGLEPIKSLLFSDYLLEEWEKAKEAKIQNRSENERNSSNEQIREE